RNKLIGEPFALSVAKEDRRKFLGHLLLCRSERSEIETELNLQDKAGNKIPVILRTNQFSSDISPGAQVFQSAIIDLTEAKEAEAKLRKEEERYRTLFDSVPIAVYSCDINGVIKEVNQRAIELWGRQPNRNGAPEKYCGSLKIFHPNGKRMPHHQCPMARAL